MPKIIEAVYEHGVLKLVKPSAVPMLKEHQQIRLIILPQREKPPLTLEEMLKKPPVEGSITELTKEEIVEDV